MLSAELVNTRAEQYGMNIITTSQYEISSDAERADPCFCDHLKTMRPSTLKVGLYLFKLNSGGSMTLSIPALAEAVGIKKRTTINALAQLEGLGVIQRTRHRGRSNGYHLLIEFGIKLAPVVQQRDTETPIDAIGPETAPEEAEVEAIAPAVTEADVEKEKLKEVDDLVARVYRKLAPDERARLLSEYESTDTLERLRLRRTTSVAADAPFGFFLRFLLSPPFNNPEPRFR
jgi:hypothetical protein